MLCALSLVAVGLTVTGVVGVNLFRGYLVDQNSQELASFAHTIASTRWLQPTDWSLNCGNVPNDNAVELLSDANGISVISSCGATVNQSKVVVPPPSAATLAAAVESGQPITESTKVASVGVEWQIVVVPERFRSVDLPTTHPPAKAAGKVVFSASAPATEHASLSGYVMVATPLNNVENMVNHLVDLDLAVDSAVVLALLGLGYVLVRRTLLPLRRIEGAATAISAGDLGRRIPHAHPKTEIGRLSLSLNSMLGQIETAFGAQASSEAEALRSEANMRQFAADASHELRTPLASIRGITELYRQGAADSRQVPDLMRRIEDEASRMGLLVEDLLLLARLDQRRPLARDHIHLVALAADAIVAARARAADRTIELRAEPPGGAGAGAGRGTEPIVIGDESRLRQALDNLLTNAVRHTPAGTPITVRVQPSEEPGHHLLEVLDTGPGLSEEDAAHVFERFYRADPSRARTTAHQGSGLGLTIVAAIAQAHGGSVSVRTEPGRGACFTLSLPAAPGLDEL